MAEEKKRKKRREDSSERRPQRDEQIIEKLISVRRVTKVVKGGKNMRFSALVVVGDGKGRVGYATGKAREVPDAVKKAVERAKKGMIRVPLRENRTLHHDISAQAGASTVYLRSAPAGTGVIAGGAMRFIFEALGIHDVVSKSVGTSNYHNTVRATFMALQDAKSPRSIAAKLGKKTPEILARIRGSRFDDGREQEDSETGDESQEGMGLEHVLGDHKTEETTAPDVSQ